MITRDCKQIVSYVVDVIYNVDPNNGAGPTDNDGNWCTRFWGRNIPSSTRGQVSTVNVPSLMGLLIVS